MYNNRFDFTDSSNQKSCFLSDPYMCIRTSKIISKCYLLHCLCSCIHQVLITVDLYTKNEEHPYTLYMYMHTYTACQKKSEIFQYLPVLPLYLEGTSEGTCTFVGTVRLKHITRVKKFLKKRAAVHVHTQLTSSLVDRCLYCCRAMY